MQLGYLIAGNFRGMKLSRNHVKYDFHVFKIHESLENGFGKVIAICVHLQCVTIIFSQSYHYSRNLQKFHPLKISNRMMPKLYKPNSSIIIFYYP